MKFYLTKKAQLEAEGRVPAVAKAPRAAKVDKNAETAKTLHEANEPKVSRRKTKGAGSESTVQEAALQPIPTPAPSEVAVAAPLVAVDNGRAVPAAATPMSAAPVMASGTPPVVSPRKSAKAAKPPKGVVAVGGEPRVDLLPPEVRMERRGAQTARRAWIGVGAVAAVMVLATLGATVLSTTAQTSLASTQAQTAGLLTQQAKYTKVKVAQENVGVIKKAQYVAGAADIDWTSYLQKVQASLPTGVVMTSVDVSTSTPMTAFAQATTPLAGVRVATITFTATSSTLPSIPTWLDDLAQLPGFVDANPGTVSSSTAGYTAAVTMDINQNAYSGKYSAEDK